MGTHRQFDEIHKRECCATKRVVVFVPAVEVVSYNNISQCDVQGIVHVQNKIFGSTTTKEQLEKEVSVENDVLITIVRVDGMLAGYSIGYSKKGKFYIWMLGVLPDYRGKGIATKVIKEQERHAKEKKYPAVTVKSSPKWKDMMRLLILLDFIIIGYKANEWGPHAAVWFEKLI